MSDPRPARAVVVGIDGSRAATHAALWAVDEAVNRDIPLRLVYVIDPSQLSAAGEGGGQSAARAALHDASRKVEATGQPVKIETEVLCGRPLTKLMQESRSAAMLCVGSVGWLSGSCLLVRRSAFGQVGGFDERYFMYMEDVDLGDRLGKAGWLSVYVPSAEVLHHKAHSTGRDRQAIWPPITKAPISS